MKPIDYAKALGAGVLLLALNLALTTVAIFAYATLIEPGRPPAYYNELAPGIATWTAPIGGALLFLAAGWLFARRRPDRNAIQFIAAVWVAYGLVDAALGLPMGGLAALLQPVFFLHLAASLAAGLLGATLAQRGRERAPAL